MTYPAEQQRELTDRITKLRRKVRREKDTARKLALMRDVQKLEATLQRVLSS